MNESTASFVAVPGVGVRAELVRTLQACLVIALLSVMATWAFSTYVMTPEVYHRLLGRQMESARIDRYIAFVQQIAWYSYIMTAGLVLARLLGSALLLQFFSLCGCVELPLRRALFVSACAYAALLCQAFARVVQLWRLRDPGLKATMMASQPGSLASFMNPASQGSLGFVLLSMVSVSELAWVALMVLLLGRVAPIRLWARIAIVLGVWTTTSAFQAGLAVYFIGLGAS